MDSILSRYSVVPVLVAAGFCLTNCGWTFAQSDATPAASQSESPPEVTSPDVPSPTPTTDTSPSEKTDDLGYQVLMQGPVHEAFAAPIDTDMTDGVRVYSKPPPEPVDEQPPEASSEQEGMKWIPGYWSWSDDEDDYVWVSGLWRKFPPGRTWNPGSWTKTGSGYRWTSGYWSRPQSSTAEVEYLPLPPKSIDNGPSVPPPADDSFWVPGHWQYVDTNYHWRGGFWSAPQPNWIWQPACYAYTPHGYLSVDGYWDYLPGDRGQLYAPVTFYDRAYLQPNYVYRPCYPIANAASLLLNLFVRSGYPHYYYGNFRGPSYLSIGYRPWYDHSIGHGYASPWLNYYDSKYRRSGINFVGSMQRYENHLRANPSQRSPHQHVGKQPTIASGSSSKTLALKKVKFGRALDNVVRSDIGRVPTSQYKNRSIGSAGRTITGPQSSFSRSSVLSTPRVNNQPGFSPNRSSSINRSFDTSRSWDRSHSFDTGRRFDTSQGRSGSIPLSTSSLPSSNTRLPSSVGRSSFRSSTASPSISRRSTITPSVQSNPSFNRSSQFSRSPSTRSIGSTPSFQRSPSQSFNRSSSPSIGRSPSQSFNRGSSPSFQRSSSPSMNRGRSASGISGRSSLGGGSNRSFGGGSSRSSGSRGRGKGK